MYGAVALALLVGVETLAAPVSAQSLSLASGNSKMPIEIYAEQGIEWRRGDQNFIARGNARAVRDDVTVHADELTAHYREAKGGKSEITRIDADGKVRIVSPTETVTGDKGIYDVETGVLVLTGKKLKLVTPHDTVTARDSLEYWERRQMAVARGNALAVQGDRRIKADILTAHFNQDSKGKSSISRIEAFGDVLISTKGDVARGERGVYNLVTGLATLAGSVKITRGENQLNGEFAEINLNTGISRLTMGPNSVGTRRRVRGLFVPEKKAADSKPTTDSKDQ
jgi:lipopolysaccharide export system protein LptA